GKDFLVVGSVRLGNDGSIETRFRLHDVQAGKEMGGQSLVIGRQHLHRVAHRISDFIYEKLTGKQGPLSSRLAYVTKSTDRYLLMIADADGDYPQTAMVSKEPITSLAWAPEGRRIALVSHEAINPATGLSHPMVFMLSLASGQRQLLFNPLLGETVAGITWSPDGTSVAVMSRKGDRSALVVINVDGKEEKPISISRSEDANPAFSADSQYIYFDSNRSGSQQIYRIPVRSGSPEQVFKGANESLAPSPSRDGKTLAYIARSGFQERLAVLDLASGTSTVLQESPASQRLSFAANGDFFLFSEKSNGTSILKAVSMETLGSISWTTASEAANSTDFVLSPAENKEP
ncbi:MAG TPA: Tol-Pal system protein TolB, partial [Azonexus sp.]|nr:Tol-Pal system protein TolB [Azonexus sp.]